jgi:prepilin-type N-terminal cleavage/methylation domain-containing protein
MTNYHNTNNAGGFTLVELSIALVIIGLTLGAVLGVGSAQLQSSRISATKQKIEVIKLALGSYIARNNRLPCPAIATLTNFPVADPNYGVEAADPGTCTGTMLADGVATGVVPFVTLGIGDEIASDGYYSRFTYQVTQTATNRTEATIAGLSGDITTHDRTPVVVGTAPPTGTQTNVHLGVVAIISHGANKSGSYSSSGIQSPLTGADETENANGDGKVVIKDFSNDEANPYDDIVVALSPSELLTPLTSRGVLDDYRARLNKDFASYRNAVIVYAVANKDTVTGEYPLPIPKPALQDVSVDPWGNAYVYTRVKASVQTTVLDTGEAFNVRSLGPDGADSTDDVLSTTYANQVQETIIKIGG